MQEVAVCIIKAGLLVEEKEEECLHFRAFIRCFCPKQLAVIHTYIHTPMVVAAVWGSSSCPRTLQHAGLRLGLGHEPATFR